MKNCDIDESLGQYFVHIRSTKRVICMCSRRKDAVKIRKALHQTKGAIK